MNAENARRYAKMIVALTGKKSCTKERRNLRYSFTLAAGRLGNNAEISYELPDGSRTVSIDKAIRAWA